MNRKHEVFGLLVFTVLMLNIPSAVLAEDAQYEASNVTIQLGSDEKELNFTWFSADGSESDLIICRKDKLKDGAFPKNAVQYSGTVEAVDTDTYACKVTSVKVNPNQEYAYAVGSGDAFSEIYYFKTQNPGGFNFIFVGDPQIGASRNETSDAEGWRAAVRAALTKFEKTSFILSAGDQVESSSSDSQYNGFFSPAELTSIPFAPAIGNHDTSELYAYHFNIPNESELGQSTDRRSGDPDGAGGDYWFTYKNTLFMVLNTNSDSFLEHSTFMADVINANPCALWKVVVFHHSLYSSASHITDVNTIRLGMAPLMDLYDIDVVLSGHDHFYARTHQLVSGEEDKVCVTTTSMRCPPPGMSGECEEVTETKCVELNDEVVPEELLTYNKNGDVVDPIGTVYFTANSASGSKFYTLDEIEGYTNVYLAKYDPSKTQSYLNVEVKGADLSVSAWSVEDNDGDGEPELIDTYSIHKDVD